MKILKFSYLGLMTLFCLTIYGCADNVVLEQEIAINKSGWSYLDTLVFEFEVEDTTKSVDFLLDVRYNENFGYENLYTEVTTIFPNKDSTTEKLSFELRSADAMAQTNCRSGSCTVPIVMLENASFTQKGSHVIKINQFSRVDSLLGIECLKLKIIKK